MPNARAQAAIDDRAPRIIGMGAMPYRPLSGDWMRGRLAGDREPVAASEA